MADAGTSKNENSAFGEAGLAATIKATCEEIRQLYLSDEIPWVIGYSGGKDSSAVLQLVWLALKGLPRESLKKPIHVISTDTLVEQPVVAAWVVASHAKMRKAAEKQELPFIPHRLTPDVHDAFWVNLIGKGYPAPRKTFRWCTSRMKINPSNNFIRSVVRDSGEAILILGTRKAESSKRHANMDSQPKVGHAAVMIRDRLSPNASLPNSLVYTPVEDWTNDDVWLFLMQVKNPWGHTNKSLLGMYQGASSDGECPLVVDSTTPSCGNSRFGCWVCTLVDKDRSMEAMIKNDDEKVWMTPLLELRNDLGDFAQEKSRRDFRRMNGRIYLEKSRTEGKEDLHVRGPYKKPAREYWLRKVLEAQQEIRRLGPKEFQDIELISLAEMQEIRRIWLYEKHEFDDAVPAIYEDVINEEFPKVASDDNLLRSDDWKILRDVCGDDEAFFELQASLLDVEREYRGMSRRAGIYEALEDRFKLGQYGNEDKALEIRRDEEHRRREADEVDDQHEPIIVQKALFEDREPDEVEAI